MTIGIDGGALSISDDRLKVGVYRVAYNLIRELPALDVKSNYRVYGFKRGEEGSQVFHRNNVDFVLLPRPGFQKIWQPIELIRNPVTVFLGISQSLPFTLYDVKKIGFIYDVGFLDHPEYYRESYFALTRQTADVINRSDHIVTISYASRTAICKRYHIPEDNVSVAYLGVDKQFHTHGIKHHSAYPYFLYVGALKPGKNVPMMLRAFAKFLETSKQTYDFILAGSDYWPDPGISATINSLRLQDRVRYTGFLDDESLARYYRGATAFVTVSMIEGFGLPAVEAMASGIAVISSTVGSNPEVVKDAGILIDPGDDDALARTFLKVSKYVRLRENLAAKGIVRARQFSWRTFAQSVLRITKEPIHHK